MDLEFDFYVTLEHMVYPHLSQPTVARDLADLAVAPALVSYPLDILVADLEFVCVHDLYLIFRGRCLNFINFDFVFGLLVPDANPWVSEGLRASCKQLIVHSKLNYLSVGVYR